MSTEIQDNLEGQRALVTGATSGIGRAVALAELELVQMGRQERWDALVEGRPLAPLDEHA